VKCVSVYGSVGDVNSFPECIQKFVTTDDFVGPTHYQLEDFELLVGKLYLLAILQYLMRTEVNFDMAELNDYASKKCN
jgi:hypothetical protein